MERRRTFSREFKLEAVNLVTEHGVTVAEAAKDLDVHEHVLRKWVRELREAPQEAFPGNGKQTVRDAEIARLRNEVAKLKMERDILKKAAVRSTGQSNTLAASVSADVAKPSVLRGLVLSCLASSIELTLAEA